MGMQHTTDWTWLGVASSVYCYVIYHYMGLTISASWFDAFLSYGVKIFGITAGASTTIGFYLKYEKRILRVGRNMIRFLIKLFNKK